MRRQKFERIEGKDKAKKTVKEKRVRGSHHASLCRDQKESYSITTETNDGLLGQAGDRRRRRHTEQVGAHVRVGHSSLLTLTAYSLLPQCSQLAGLTGDRAGRPSLHVAALSLDLSG